LGTVEEYKERKGDDQETDAIGKVGEMTNTVGHFEGRLDDDDNTRGKDESAHLKTPPEEQQSQLTNIRQDDFLMPLNTMETMSKLRWRLLYLMSTIEKTSRRTTSRPLQLIKSLHHLCLQTSTYDHNAQSWGARCITRNMDLS
jgi:hypothetical protein